MWILGEDHGVGIASVHDVKKQHENKLKFYRDSDVMKLTDK